jgi:hypothetical protein
MSPQEVRLTLRVTTILSIVTLLLGVGASYAVAKTNAEHLHEVVVDHESRIREIESCVSDIASIKDTVRDVPAMRTDIRWIVYTLERMQAEE